MRYFSFRIVIALLGGIFAFLWQESNLDYLQDQFPQKVQNGFVITADDASYLQPAVSFVDQGVWKDKTRGNSSYVQRPPGYGMVFAICYAITPEYAYHLLKVIQLLAYTLSILLVMRLLDLFKFHSKWILIAGLVYALSPCYMGFIYHTLSESLTVLIFVWSMVEWVKVWKNRETKAAWITSNAFLLLIRPQMLLFVLVFELGLLLRQKRNLLVWSSLIFMPFMLWQLRTLTITGSLSLHPIYAENNHSMYRPPHRALGELFKVWEYKSDRFHETVQAACLSEDSSSFNQAMEAIPQKFREEVRPVMRDFQSLYKQQASLYGTDQLEELMDSEIDFIKRTEVLTKKLTKENIAQAYFTTPVKSAKELFVNSHLHLSLFQLKYRGQWWMELLRWISLTLVLSGIATAFIMSAMHSRIPNELWLMSFASVAYLLYLIFVQRLNEERYLTPLLPIFFITLNMAIQQLTLRIRKK